MKFKVLVHNRQFVNESLLEKGIYTTNIPYLRDMADSIESMLERYRFYSSLPAGDIPNEEYENNLRKCELVVVNIEVE